MTQHYPKEKIEQFRNKLFDIQTLGQLAPHFISEIIEICNTALQLYEKLEWLEKKWYNKYKKN